MFESSPQHIASYYAASTEPGAARAPLMGALDVDVVIVGAGYTGLYTALRLVQAGKSVAIVEASRVGWGASGRNGGQAILGFSCDMPPFEAALGEDGARRVWRLIEQAGVEIRQRIAEHHIDCDFAEGHLWTSVLDRRVHLLHDWQHEASRKWGYDRLRFIAKADLPQHVASSRYQAGLLDEGGGQLHPLKYISGLARAAEAMGVRIYEGTRALRYTELSDGVELVTEGGYVRAHRLVLACGAYVDRLDPRGGSHVLPVGSYIIATAPLGEVRAKALLPSGCAVSDNQFVLDYFRLSADHRLLFGGKCTYTGRTPRHLAQGMREDMLKVFPQLADVNIDFAWGGHIDITMARTPDFGRQGPVYWAQGFSGHGIVPTCVAGRVVAEALLGDDSQLRLFEKMNNPAFPGGEKLAAMFQVLGMSYYRLRDYF